MRELRRPCVASESAPRGHQTRRRCVIMGRWPHRLAGMPDTTADGGTVCSETLPDSIEWPEDEPEIGSPRNGPDADDNP